MTFSKVLFKTKSIPLKSNSTISSNISSFKRLDCWQFDFCQLVSKIKLGDYFHQCCKHLCGILASSNLCFKFLNHIYWLILSTLTKPVSNSNCCQQTSSDEPVYTNCPAPNRITSKESGAFSSSREKKRMEMGLDIGSGGFKPYGLHMVGRSLSHRA